ncbi:hypothetical protein BGE01nite_50730 [Brevifollis gellanilyticus]|uniref:Uncharacterized protein n=2 Tax=Brevifollis gellanilyticus TaxID=748831 RepID=A0A512MGB4_9BACT|nr:hypothetical protein BGE01nite_50730 [Brevifollis gellanilyticus]
MGWVVSCAPVPPKTDREIAAESITEDFVVKYVRPFADPVAKAAHTPDNLPEALLLANKITLVEVIPMSARYVPEDPKVVYTGRIDRPPNSGMITGVPNAQKIGLFFPAKLDQPEVEVRMNYSCDVCGFIAVHLIVPNPLLVNPQTQN